MVGVKTLRKYIIETQVYGFLERTYGKGNWPAETTIEGFCYAASAMAEAYFKTADVTYDVEDADPTHFTDYFVNGGCLYMVIEMINMWMASQRGEAYDLQITPLVRMMWDAFTATQTEA